MIKTLSDYYKIDDKKFDQLGILNAFTDIDTQLYLDPLLLNYTTIPEFSDSRNNFKNYFKDIVTLLVNSNSLYDLPSKTAFRKLIFREMRGVAIGHGQSTSDGSGVGAKLAFELLKRARELIQYGVKDPELFELIGLFIDGFGPDRLSDMTVRIIQKELFLYTQRNAKELGIATVAFREYQLPLHPSGRKPTIFLPKELLRRFPVAQSWDDIENIVYFNSELRSRLNKLISGIFVEVTKKEKKAIIREQLLKEPENFKEFIESYKTYKPKSYDFVKDPNGQVKWHYIGKKFAEDNPIDLQISTKPSLIEIESVVTAIIKQFKKNIEVNGLNLTLYRPDGKPLHERYSQLLFYSVSDTYCAANNIGLSRESNAGTGSVDFKYNYGYSLKFIVEIKLSSSSQLLHGYETQLKTYEQSEDTENSAYVVIQVSKSSNNIRNLLKLQRRMKKEGKRIPNIYLINARIRPSASIR
jgi:hypothetical protein